MIRPIAISLSPNTEMDDVGLALRMLFSPRRWKNKKEIRTFKHEFKKIFGTKSFVLSVNSGRSALYVILKALGIGCADEVLVQAFTCVSVPNSILWLGATPKYIDIDDSYNMDPEGLGKKITKKTKAIVIQHTFGIPADIEKIKKIADKHKLFLIEDCAHSLGAELNNRKVGTFGDVSFFSFGRDKIISSVFGGMILANKKSIYEKVKLELKNVEEPSRYWTFQQLLHPIALFLILPFYNLGLGKVLLISLQKVKLLTKAIYDEEKVGGQPAAFPKKMSPALAVLAAHQLMKLNKYNNHRKLIYAYYKNNINLDAITFPKVRGEPVWLRIPVSLSKSKLVFKKAKQKGVLLGDWYSHIVTPAKDLKLLKYKTGSCPNAEKLARSTINLPTYPTLSLSQANKVTRIIKENV